MEIPKAENSLDLKKMSAKDILSTFDKLTSFASILNREENGAVYLQLIDQKTLL